MKRQLLSKLIIGSTIIVAGAVNILDVLSKEKNPPTVAVSGIITSKFIGVASKCGRHNICTPLYVKLDTGDVVLVDQQSYNSSEIGEQVKFTKESVDFSILGFIQVALAFLTGLAFVFGIGFIMIQFLTWLLMKSDSVTLVDYIKGKFNE